MNVLFYLLMGVSTMSDGTLIFLTDSHDVVKHVTKSHVTHVAITVSENGKTWVYEADRPKVKKIEINEFYKSVETRPDAKNIRVFVVRPKIWLSRQLLIEHLDSQIGRNYSVWNYVFAGSNGVHCSQLCAEAFKRSGLPIPGDTAKISPGELWIMCQEWSKEPVEIFFK